MLLIIGSDPGKMTGVATWDERKPDADRFDSFELGVTEYFDWLHTTIHEAHSAGMEIRLVCESFIITVHTAKNTQAAWSLELIGVLKFLAHRYGLAEVKMQSPSVGKTFGTDAKLRHVGWWRSKSGHANDAARHLMTYAATNRLIFNTESLMELAQV